MSTRQTKADQNGGPVRVPPHDIAAEEALLGVCLLPPAGTTDAVATAAAICAPVDFYKPAHGHIFAAIVALHGRGEPTEPVVVTDELRRAGLLDAAGGAATLVALQCAAPSRAGAVRYAQIISDHSARRRLIGVGDEIKELGHSASKDMSAAVLRSSEMIAGLRNGKAPHEEPSGAVRLLHRPAGTVNVVPPVWRWKGWLVAAAVELLVARQGSGKSTFIAWVVAQLSTGRPWPGEADSRTPMRCGMLSLEEPDERLAARLKAAGADLEMVEILGDVEDHDDEGRPIRRPWRLPGDCAVLEDAIVALGLELVSIDGLGYSIGGDSHNYANVGSALSALASVAERTGCTIAGLTHPPKGNADAVTAAIGSTAWTAVARISWVMGADPTDESGARRVVRPAPGSNYRLPEHGLSFTIGNHDETEAGFVTNLQPSDVDAQAITSPPMPESDDGEDGEDASSVLAEILAGGPVWVKDAHDAMATAGFTVKQCRRAKERLKVHSVKHGKPGDPVQGWQWVLPHHPRRPGDSEGAQGDSEGAEGALFGGLGTFGTFGPDGAPSAPHPSSPFSPTDTHMASMANCHRCGADTSRVDDEGEPLCMGCGGAWARTLDDPKGTEP